MAISLKRLRAGVIGVYDMIVALACISVSQYLIALATIPLASKSFINSGSSNAAQFSQVEI
jgi:hypothetical protein